MTAALIAPADLSAYEFDIACEWRPQCDEPAAVMSKACADPRHYAICAEHYAYRRKWFYEQDNVVCKTCHRPWVHFETHYDIIPIDPKRKF